MTNSGSGNQGITVYLPVVVAAEQFGCSREQLIRALALSNLVAAHIHIIWDTFLLCVEF